MSEKSKRIVIGISGASGMIYAQKLLLAIPSGYEIHLVVTPTAHKIIKSELNLDLDSYLSEHKFNAKIVVHQPDNFFASIASGSFKVRGMIVVPCSMKTLSGVANGYTNSLLERAADANLKERRRVILVVRETPLNQIHLRNMLNADKAGAVILPAMPAFYNKPQTISDLADFIVARILNQLDIEQNIYPGWGEQS